MTQPDRAEFEPGQRVLHPERPEWGIGQVQSAIGNRVTVHFEHAGKVLIELSRVALTTLDGGAEPA